MTWISTLVTAILGAAGGFFGMALVGSAWSKWFRFSQQDGGAGYAVAFLAILGGIVGALIGLLASRAAVQGGNANFGRGIGVTAAIITSTLALLLAVSWLMSDRAPTLEGQRLIVEVELRTPPVTPLLSHAGFEPGVSLFGGPGKANGYNTDYGSTNREDGERRVIVTRVDLRTRSLQKQLWMRIDDECHLEAAVDLPATPTRAHFEWTAWRDVTCVAPSGAWAAAGVDTRFAVRTRVQFAPPPKPVPTSAEIEAERAAEQARADQEQLAQIAALPDTAHIAAWLPFTAWEVSDGVRTAALARMRQSPRFGAQLAEVMQHADADTAATWLRLSAKFPGDRGPVVEAVRRAGEALAKELEDLAPGRKNAAAARNGPYSALARFGGFFGAAFELREQGAGDFTPELRAILLAARACQQLPGVRSDIVRVASYYLQQWAGDAPLPGDPPPK